jgi:ribA/ribD-fused uncharacterized protein
MKPHQRKQTQGGESSQPQTTNDPNLPTFFYMPREQPYGCFCQWKSGNFKVPISTLSWLKFAHPKNTTQTLAPEDEFGTLEFNCAEQFMMYCKAVFFSDQASAEKIMGSEDPAHQKKMGRLVKGFSADQWRSVCERVVFEGNWWKFSQNRAYREALMGTGERELCEASRSDRLWGIGYNAKEALQYRRLWGENLLGKGLMRVREKIKERLEAHAQYIRDDWELPDAEMWEALKREQAEKKERAWQKGRWTETYSDPN